MGYNMDYAEDTMEDLDLTTSQERILLALQDKPLDAAGIIKVSRLGKSSVYRGIQDLLNMKLIVPFGNSLTRAQRYTIQADELLKKNRNAWNVNFQDNVHPLPVFTDPNAIGEAGEQIFKEVVFAINRLVKNVERSALESQPEQITLRVNRQIKGTLMGHLDRIEQFGFLITQILNSKEFWNPDVYDDLAQHESVQSTRQLREKALSQYVLEGKEEQV